MSMHRFQRIEAVCLLVVLVAAACGSTDPSPTPGPASARPPATEPTISAAPSAPSGDPFLGAVVTTVSDRLRVRSQPRVSDDSRKLEPLLPLGTELEVVGGPVEASGYVWYQVATISLALTGGADRGWVAMGDHDGTPWIAVAEPPLTGIEVAMSGVERLPADPDDATGAAASITAFGLDLYRAMLADPDLSGTNVVFSPTSIALALGMARAGANGPTAAEMDDVLHTEGWAKLRRGLNALDQAIVSRDGAYEDDQGRTHQLSLRIANSTFAQRGWKMEQAFLDTIAATFGAGVQLVDYQADHEAARKTINAWVSRQTERRIPELLGEPDVSDLTRLYLVNAMYLKANWVREFDREATAPKAFTRLDGSSVSVPTMRLRGEQEVPYVRGDGWRATELRYRGRDGTYPLAMDLIMPTDLEAFEADLTSEQLAGIMKALTRERVRLNEEVTFATTEDMDCGTYPYSLQLHMPKFGAETRAKLGETLAALGMPTAFDADSADFTGIHVPSVSEARIHIADVIHQANIDVDETGTEAAAATAIGMDTGGCTGPAPAKDVTLRLDHPFLFVLRDLETGTILFLGRVVDPSIKR